MQSVLLARLFRLGLIGRYPMLVTYLGLNVATSTLMAGLLGSGNLGPYAWLYAFKQPLLWVLYFLIILELYSRMVDEYAAIRRLGRVVLFSALGCVAVAFSLLMIVHRQAGGDPYPLLSYLVLQERSVFLALSCLALLLLFFAAHFRLPVARNVWVLYVCWAAIFVGGAAVLVLRQQLGQDFTQIRNLSGHILYSAALLGAVVFVSRQGEAQLRPISLSWGDQNPELEHALSLQLQSFNQVLMKALQQ